MSDETKPGAVPLEFSGLLNEAAGDSAPPVPPAGNPAAPESVPLRDQIAGLIDFAVSFGDIGTNGTAAAPAVPPASLADIYTKERKAALADAAAAFCEKYGLSVPGVMEKYRVELNLAFALFAVVPATMLYLKSKSETAPAGAPAPVAAPSEPGALKPFQ